jgi:hypothetical protein
MLTKLTSGAGPFSKVLEKEYPDLKQVKTFAAALPSSCSSHEAENSFHCGSNLLRDANTTQHPMIYAIYGIAPVIGHPSGVGMFRQNAARMYRWADVRDAPEENNFGRVLRSGRKDKTVATGDRFC